MRLLTLLLGWAAGCAPWPHVEHHAPSDLERSAAVAVAHPVGHAFALDPDVLQREVAEGLRRAGFARVTLLRQGASDRAGADLLASVRSDLMARPLEDDGGFREDRAAGDGNLAILLRRRACAGRASDHGPVGNRGLPGNPDRGAVERPDGSNGGSHPPPPAPRVDVGVLRRLRTDPRRARRAMRGPPLQDESRIE